MKNILSLNYEEAKSFLLKQSFVFKWWYFAKQIYRFNCSKSSSGSLIAETITTWSTLATAGWVKKFLRGKSFVITGTLTTMSRDQAADRIRALGGTFQTAVAKDTTYLVAGGKVGASKLKKAESYGTKVITEAELEQLI